MTDERTRTLGFVALTLGFALSGLALSACQGERSAEPPITPIRNMHSQPKYKPQAESPFFADKRAMRPQVEGTVSREAVVSLEEGQGLSADGAHYVDVIPESVVRKMGGAGQTGYEKLLTRGQERYGIYCTPCHGQLGNGEGMVVRRGMLKPPSFHDERLRHAPDGQIFATISNGIRNMPAYKSQVPVNDRWAIVAYLRALQANIAAKTPQKTATLQGQ